MSIEHIKKIFMIFMMYLALVGLWSLTASFTEGYPTPTSTMHAAFGGIDESGDEIESIFATAFEIEDDEEKGIFWHVMTTMAFVFGGFALVLLVGLPLGVFVGLNPTFAYGYDVITKSLKVISPILWLPFVLLLVQDVTLVALFSIFFAALWPVVSSTAEGVSSVHKDYLKMSKVLQLSRTEKLIEIILPLVVPYIFAGVKRSLWIAWVTVIPLEMLMEDQGIGHWIWYSYNEGMYEHMIIGMFLVYLIGLGVGYLIQKVTHYFDYMESH
jgi:nitrate/nitrite transport system permease protein